MGRQRSLGERIWLGYLWSLRVVCALLMVWIVGVTLINVATRYIIDEPIVWADEAARLTFVVFTFLAASLAAASHDHLSIDSLVNRLPAVAQRIVAGFGVFCLLSFAALLLVGGWETATTLKQVSPALGFPLSWVYASIPVGAVLILISSFGAWRYPHTTRREQDMVEVA